VCGARNSHVKALSLKQLLLMSEEAWTLSMLLDHLSPFMAQLSVLSQLYTHGIEACTEVASASYKASHLLEEIFNILMHLGNLGEDRCHLV